MRGNDVTPEQLEAAAAFLDLTRLSERPQPHQMVTSRYCDVLQLLAWYGAVRYQAALDGIGDTGRPGIVGRQTLELE